MATELFSQFSPLSEQQRMALLASPGNPLPVVDTETKDLYYLISATAFEKVRALLSLDEFSPAELYPLIAKTAAAAGWDDPAMDVYDEYDKHRAKG